MGTSVELFWSGDVDLANITPIRHQLDAALNSPGVDRVIIDLAAVSFVDSLGLGMLVYAFDAALPRGITVVVRNVPDRTRRLIAVAGLTELLTADSGG